MSDRETRRRILEPAAFGIHYAIEDELEQYISRNFYHSTFSFHEIFLHRPINLWEDRTELFKRPFEISSPFVSRLLRRTGYIPAVNDYLADAMIKDWHRNFRKKNAKGQEGFLVKSINVSTVPATPSNLEKYDDDLEFVSARLEDTFFLRDFVSLWMNPRGSVLRKDPWRNMFLSYREEIRPAVSVVGVVNQENTFSLYKDQLRASLNKKSKQEVVDLLREYGFFFERWRKPNTIVCFISVPIASDVLFWGECIVVLPLDVSKGQRSMRPILEDKRVIRIKDILIRNVQDTFVPIMTIVDNYIGELKFRRLLKKLGAPNLSKAQSFINRVGIKWLGFKWVEDNKDVLSNLGLGKNPSELYSASLQAPNFKGSNIVLSILYECLRTAKDEEPTPWTRLGELERALARVWAARFAFVLGNASSFGRNRRAILERASESLVFQKYLVTSPRILKEIINVTKLRHGDRGEGQNYIKTALVVGGPGSGKDSMAKLIRLLSPGYRLGPLTTLNMATFRPKEAAVPLLLGLSVHRDSEQPPTFSIMGLLQRSWQLNAAKGPIPALKKGQGSCFIFDELNSLDIDTQGALLRFLESGELMSLGAFEKAETNVDALVIGVMNEDPHAITKMKTLDRVLRDKQVFGGMLGEFLYEFFRSQRRLRDDLYFRMIRGGEIILPDLRNRREDIPVLFYFTVATDFQHLIPVNKTGSKVDWKVELSLYEELMDKSLNWEGNVRELQTVARHILRFSVAEYESSQPRSPKLVFRGTHAREALEEHARASRAVEREPS